jgi:hypothetical protein
LTTIFTVLAFFGLGAVDFFLSFFSGSTTFLTTCFSYRDMFDEPNTSGTQQALRPGWR